MYADFKKLYYIFHWKDCRKTSNLQKFINMADAVRQAVKERIDFMRKTLKVLLAVILVVVLVVTMTGFTSDNYNDKNKCGSTVTVNGESIYFERSGNQHSCNTIIFIHGAFINSQTMKFLSQEKAFKNYNCITFDLPGHGKSEGSGKSTVADYTKSVYDFIDILKDKGIITDKITLVGWSMGGTISLELAEDGLKGLQNVVLLDSSAKWEINLPPMDPSADIDLRPVFFSEFTSLTPQYVKDVFDRDYNKYVSGKDTIISDVMSVNNYDKITDLSKIQVPVLAISGDSDKLAPPEYETILRKNIPECYMKIYPKRGHILFMEVPEDISEDIVEFFQYSN